MMRKTVVLLMVGFWLLQAAAAGAAVVDRVVAQVNDDIVLLSELNRAMAPVVDQILRQEPDQERRQQAVAQMGRKVLDQLIEDKLFEQQVRKLGIVVDDGQVDQAIEQIKATYHYTDQQLRQVLERDGLTWQQYKERIRQQLERARVVAYEVRSKIVITEADIQQYYQQNLQRYGQRTRLHLRHIFMAAGSGEEEHRQARDRMEQVLARLKDGMAFAEAARAYSQSLAEEGGDLGLIAVEDLAPEIRQAVEALEEGQFTGVLDTERGLQIFYLEQRVTDPPRPLDQVREEIRRNLYERIVEERYNKWMGQLRRRSLVKVVYDPFQQPGAEGRQAGGDS